uniref:Uncharacterized protein n=1 Tax=Arundo donax TaxID=35708 RepID=A0A0A8ZQL1_ARUDO
MSDWQSSNIANIHRIKTPLKKTRCKQNHFHTTSMVCLKFALNDGVHGHYAMRKGSTVSMKAS